MTPKQPSPSRTIRRALLVASLLLSVAVTLALLSPDHVSTAVAQRLFGAMVGAVVVCYANAAPKALTPLARMRCDPVAEQALRRFLGWSMTMGGAGYTLAWMLAPIEVANVLATSLLGAAMLLVLFRIARHKARQSRA